MSLDEGECRKHGADRHMFVHEAAHAVAGIDFEVNFSYIEIRRSSLPASGIYEYPAGIEMPFPANDWVRRDKVAAMLFLGAGHVGEMAVLEDAYSESWRADMAVWRVGMGGPTTALTVGQLDTLLGPPGHEALGDRLDEWAAASADRISLVARELESRSAPHRFSMEEVVRLIGPTAPRARS